MITEADKLAAVEAVDAMEHPDFGGLRNTVTITREELALLKVAQVKAEMFTPRAMADEQPTRDGWYLIFVKDRSTWIPCYWLSCRKWAGLTRFDSVAYWMPMPPAPVG